MHSLRFKITAVTTAAILTSILSLGLIGIFFVGIISNQSSVEKMNLLSENIQEKLDVYLNSLQQSVDMAINIANDSTTELEAEMISAAADSPEQMEKLNTFLKEHSSQIMRSFTSIANNSAGVVTYYYCINMDLGSSENGFFYSKVEKDNFEEQEPLRSHDLDPNDLEHLFLELIVQVSVTSRHFIYAFLSLGFGHLGELRFIFLTVRHIIRTRLCWRNCEQNLQYLFAQIPLQTVKQLL